MCNYTTIIFSKYLLGAADLINSVKEKRKKSHSGMSTLCNPMDCSLPVSSVHEIFQARVLEWVAVSLSRGSSRPRIESRSPALQTDTLLSEPPGKPLCNSLWLTSVIWVDTILVLPGKHSYSTSFYLYSNIMPWYCNYLLTCMITSKTVSFSMQKRGLFIAVCIITKEISRQSTCACGINV